MFKGKVWKYGDNVDTDVIIPARYLNSTKAEDLAAHCMEDIDKEFASTSKSSMLIGNAIINCATCYCFSSFAFAPLGFAASLAKNSLLNLRKLS